MRNTSRFAAAVAAAFVAALGVPGAPAVAQFAAFELFISELESELPEGGPSMTVSSAELVFLRSKPYIELKNSASSTAPITEFRMTIGDEAFHFSGCSGAKCAGFVKIGANSDGLPLSQIQSTVEDNGNVLVLNFLNGGLQPDQFVHFRIDIDADSSKHPQHADYGTVLFDYNGHQWYKTSPDGISTDDNSQVTAIFQTPGMPAFTLGPIPFDDPKMNMGGNYVNGLQLARGSNRSSVDPTRMFQLPFAAIPEPGSIFLAAAGAFSVLACRRSRLVG